MVIELLQQLGAKNLFVEIGGEIRVTGDKAGDPWKVGIQQPDIDGLKVAVAYPLKDRAIATSGDYRSFFEYQGQRYSIHRSANHASGKSQSGIGHRAC